MKTLDAHGQAVEAWIERAERPPRIRWMWMGAPSNIREVRVSPLRWARIANRLFMATWRYQYGTVSHPESGVLEFASRRRNLVWRVVADAGAR